MQQYHYAFTGLMMNRTHALLFLLNGDKHNLPTHAFDYYNASDRPAWWHGDQIAHDQHYWLIGFIKIRSDCGLIQIELRFKPNMQKLEKWRTEFLI